MESARWRPSWSSSWRCPGPRGPSRPRWSRRPCSSRSPTAKPRGFQLNAARRPADRGPASARAPRAGGARAAPARGGAAALLRAAPARYEVAYKRGDRTLIDIHIDGITGEVVEQWTGPQADMLARARLHPVRGRPAEPLVRVAPARRCCSWRRSWTRAGRSACCTWTCWCCSAFGVSEYFFNKGNVDVSVPLVYPLLGYLCIRLALAGFRPRARSERLMPYARTSWLVIGLVALMIFRVGLNVTNSTIMDVGCASVIGADRITHKQDLYMDNDMHGDTYGPVNYLAYVPFELALPERRQRWGEVPAAQAAALAFDLLTVIGLMLLGRAAQSGAGGAPARRGHGLRLGGLSVHAARPPGERERRPVAVLLVFALLALTSPAKRGLMVGLAAAAKFAPVVLVPLFATGTGEEPRGALLGGLRRRVQRRRGRARSLLYLPDGGLREFYNCTIGFQMNRYSVFSLWGLHPSLGWLQDIVKVGRAAVRGGAGLRAAPAGHAPGGRPRRRRAHRGAAGREPLVLLLHPVVRAVRAARDVRRLPRPRARGRARRGAADVRRVASPV